MKQELENVSTELKILKEKSALSSDSLGQAEKRVQSLQSLLTEKNSEVGCGLGLEVDCAVER